MKLIVIGFLAFIVASLGSALLFLVRDRSHNRSRVAKALTLRIALSITLFVMLMASYYFGLITNRL